MVTAVVLPIVNSSMAVLIAIGITIILSPYIAVATCSVTTSTPNVTTNPNTNHCMLVLPSLFYPVFNFLTMFI